MQKKSFFGTLSAFEQEITQRECHCVLFAKSDVCKEPSAFIIYEIALNGFEANSLAWDHRFGTTHFCRVRTSLIFKVQPLPNSSPPKCYLSLKFKHRTNPHCFYPKYLIKPLSAQRGFLQTSTKISAIKEMALASFRCTFYQQKSLTSSLYFP